MIAQTIVHLPSPVTLDLRLSTRPRPRVIQGEPIPAGERVDELHEFATLPLYLVVDAAARSIAAYLPPIPYHLPLYGPEDYAAAAGDSMEDHANRVLQLLGSDPAMILQALLDGEDLPSPPTRVPREIPNWRCKAVLTQMGMLGDVEAVMEAMPEPDRSIAKLAWQGDGKVARRGKTVLGMAAVLKLSDARLDAMFVAADRIEV